MDSTSGFDHSSRPAEKRKLSNDLPTAAHDTTDTVPNNFLVAPTQNRRPSDTVIVDHTVPVPVPVPTEQDKRFLNPTRGVTTKVGRLLPVGEPSKSTGKHDCGLCPSNARGFRTLNDLARHKRGVHGIYEHHDKIWRCRFEGCTVSDKIWPRRDNFVGHLQRMHYQHDVEEARRIADDFQELYDERIHGTSTQTGGLLQVEQNDIGTKEPMYGRDQPDFQLNYPDTEPFWLFDHPLIPAIDYSRRSPKAQTAWTDTSPSDRSEQVGGFTEEDWEFHLSSLLSPSPQDFRFLGEGLDYPLNVDLSEPWIPDSSRNATVANFIDLTKHERDFGEPPQELTGEQKLELLNKSKSFSKETEAQREDYTLSVGKLPNLSQNLSASQHESVQRKAEQLDHFSSLSKKAKFRARDDESPFGSHTSSLPSSILDSDLKSRVKVESLASSENRLHEKSFEQGFEDSAPTRKFPESEALILKFTKQIVEDLGTVSLDASLSAILQVKLPALFADFAIRLGQDHEYPKYRGSMSFLYLCRHDLSVRLLHLIGQAEDLDQVFSGARATEKLLVNRKIQAWQEDLDFQQKLGSKSRTGLDSAEDKYSQPIKDNDMHEFAMHCAHGLNSFSYRWLVAQIRNVFLLTSNENDSLTRIAQEVSTALPQSKYPQPNWPHIFHSVLEVRWPLKQFLVSELAQSDVSDIAQAITITLNNDLGNAQLLTCAEYTEMVWPVTGVYLVKLLQSLASSEDMARHYCERPDGTYLEVHEVTPSLIRVEVIGSCGVIAEVAQQLAWLSSSLRAAPASSRILDTSNKVISVYVPSIQHVYEPLTSMRDAVDHEIDEIHRREQYSKMRKDSKNKPRRQSQSIQGRVQLFRIEPEVADIRATGVGGTCWVQMIQDSILAGGFPVTRRGRSGLGLELPLSLMADLVGTRFVNSFAGQIFIKGYSAMLILMRRVGDLLVWHLVCNDSRKHISYLYNASAKACKVDPEKIGNYRHVVGWCSSALNYAGAADSQFPIRRARLPRASVDCILADDTISFGKPITTGANAIPSKQHLTVHARRTGYLDIFRYLSQHFILLWDTADERGWLVNGINALLHLLRTSLKIDERDSAGHEFVLKSADLKEPKRPHTPRAAREFLSELDNLRVKISVTRTGLDESGGVTQARDEYELLTDRMEQYYHVLEKALTYSKRLQRAGVGVAKHKPAYELEGWDFADLANKIELVEARVAILPAASHCWLELVRSTGVATLFGQGFGELIKPFDANCCEAWKALPTGKHYVAANMVDVAHMMELNGDPDATPRQLSESTLWHHPATAFGGCGCQSEDGVGTQLIQQPCSTLRACRCPEIIQDSSFDLEEHMAGAIIFGHNQKHGPVLVGEGDKDFEDSGLGTSLAATSSRDTNLTGDSISPQPRTRGEPSARQYGDSNIYRGIAHYGDNVRIYNYHPVGPGEFWPADMPNRSHERFWVQNEQQTGTKRNYADSDVENLQLAERQYNDGYLDDEQGSRKRSRMTTTTETYPEDVLPG